MKSNNKNAGTNNHLLTTDLKPFTRTSKHTHRCAVDCHVRERSPKQNVECERLVTGSATDQSAVRLGVATRTSSRPFVQSGSARRRCHVPLVRAVFTSVNISTTTGTKEDGVRLSISKIDSARFVPPRCANSQLVCGKSSLCLCVIYSVSVVNAGV